MPTPSMKRLRAKPKTKSNIINVSILVVIDVHSTFQRAIMCCDFAFTPKHIHSNDFKSQWSIKHTTYVKVTMKTMTTYENNGGNVDLRKSLVYMNHCACLTAFFIGISFVEV